MGSKLTFVQMKADLKEYVYITICQPFDIIHTPFEMIAIQLKGIFDKMQKDHRLKWTNSKTKEMMEFINDMNGDDLNEKLENMMINWEHSNTYPDKAFGKYSNTILGYALHNAYIRAQQVDNSDPDECAPLELIFPTDAKKIDHDTDDEEEDE